jgi:hypothetical protein
VAENGTGTDQGRMVFASDISGYLPKDSLTIFPFRLVFIFQSFEPVEAISRYRPLLSKSAYFFSFGFALFICLGVSVAIGFAIFG